MKECRGRRNCYLTWQWGSGFKSRKRIREMLVKGYKLLVKMKKFWGSNVQHGDYS